VRSLLLIVGSVIVISVVVATIASSRDSDAASRASSVLPRAAVEDGPDPNPPLPKANLRILTPTQTRRLVRYASDLRVCFVRRRVDVNGPTIQSNAITLEATTDVGLKRLVGLIVSCTAPLGDPPSPSSLQAVDARTVVLSLPKQCLLDPKVEAELSPHRPSARTRS
jgi:hypothetical protein